MKTIKNIPNYITISRLFLAVGLLVVNPLSVLFFVFYFLCGVSDVLDGYIARKMNTSSKFGQVLDSLCDLIFIAVLLWIFIPIMKLPLWILYWIAAIAAVRLLSLSIGFIKYWRLAFLHTYANKATGVLLFLFPVLFLIFTKESAVIIICVAASISAIEELCIHILSKTLNRDVRSIFGKKT